MLEDTVGKGNCTQESARAVSEYTEASIEQYDHLVHWRCPQLGGEVTFRYCRKVNDGVPCAHLIKCWKSILDVTAFVEQYYDRDEIAARWSRSRPDKMVQLANLVGRATSGRGGCAEPSTPSGKQGSTKGEKGR